MADVILTDVLDGVAVVTMNRPDARNALNTELRRAVPSVGHPATLAANRGATQARSRAQQR